MPFLVGFPLTEVMKKSVRKFEREGERENKSFSSRPAHRHTNRDKCYTKSILLLIKSTHKPDVKQLVGVT